jgi:hypothetical protein
MPKKNAEVGMRNVRKRMRKWECGMGNAKMNAEGGMRNAEIEISAEIH